MPESRPLLPMASTSVQSDSAADLALEDREALAAFAEAHGRTWKSQLKSLWLSGRDDGALRRLRNQLGSAGLDRLKLESTAAEKISVLLTGQLEVRGPTSRNCRL